ncbi:MAG: class I SAM-dependent methyltransferase [Elusimicrobiota bacterium]
MPNKLNEWRDFLGLRRGIERHNFAIKHILNKHAETLAYKGRVVDLGCGEAPYKDAILKVADEYIGVDWANTMHNQKNVDVFADLTKRLPFDDNYADTVISFEVLEHLPEPDFFLSECNRILRPQGRLFLLAPFLWQEHEAPHDYFRYTQYGLKYLLEKNGFSQIAIEGKTGFWLMWCLRFNYYTVDFARGPVKFLWYLIWWFAQIFAVLMDRMAPGSGQASIYAVYASKPVARTSELNGPPPNAP